MTIKMEEIRDIIDQETVAESGVVIRTTPAAVRILALIEDRAICECKHRSSGYFRHFCGDCKLPTVRP